MTSLETSKIQYRALCNRISALVNAKRTINDIGITTGETIDAINARIAELTEEIERLSNNKK